MERLIVSASSGDLEQFRTDLRSVVVRDFSQANALISTVCLHADNVEIVKEASLFLCEKFPLPEVGKSVLQCLMVSCENPQILLDVLYFWTTQIVKCKTALRSHHFIDVCLSSIGGNRHFRLVLKWEESNLPQDVKTNRKIMISAALRDDFELVQLLHEFGYRIDLDFPSTKDHLKLVQLMEAASSRAYIVTDFVQSGIGDPLRTLFSLATRARNGASSHQDFAESYLEIARRCEQFSCELLDSCKTTHEVELLLQTGRSDYGNASNANFEVALLDRHMEFVAHERFQQQLHLMWGQQSRLDRPFGRINIHWTEKSDLEKLGYLLCQLVHFLLLWLVPLWSFICRFRRTYLRSTVRNNCGDFGHRRRTLTQSGAKPKLRAFKAMSKLERHAAIPLNKFLYWEISKFMFYFILIATLTSEDDVISHTFEYIAIFWTLSYISENVRNFWAILNISQSISLAFKRWCTMRNAFTFACNLLLIMAFAFKVFYPGSTSNTLWSLACLMAFLRAIQGGLMWRQTGPIIISMSYMLYDILTFLGFFSVVYVSFTLVTVYIYENNEDSVSPFAQHSSAFKYFFWALIRSGNPGFVEVARAKAFDSSCLNQALNGSEWIADSAVANCLVTVDHVPSNDEVLVHGFGYGLWATYQFLVVIILLSVLRARMINTYQNIRQESDIQWKYFRANIWWNYLEASEVTLPPPFTFLDLLDQLIGYVLWLYRKEVHGDLYSEDPNQVIAPRNVANIIKQEQEEMTSEFDRKYRRLLMILLSDMRFTIKPLISKRVAADFDIVGLEVAVD